MSIAHRVAGGWFVVWLAMTGLAVVWSASSDAPRAAFGQPARLSTARAIGRGGWVELTDAHFDCDAWVPGSGRVPIRHPRPEPAVWFDRENVCHGQRADRVEGQLETSPTGLHTIRSLAPAEDPLVLGGIAAGLCLLVAVTPLVWLRAQDPERPPRRTLAELTSGVGRGMHPAFWRNEAPTLAFYALALAMGGFGAAMAGSWAWDILVDEPRTWATGEPRTPVHLDDQEGIFVTWMEGSRPTSTNVALSIFVQLEADFIGDPAVRVGVDGEVATNVGLHYANSRLLFLVEWLALCLLTAVPGVLLLPSALWQAVRWTRAAQKGDVQLVWLTVIDRRIHEDYAIPTRVEVTVQTDSGRRLTLPLRAPREAVIRGSGETTEALVATVRGVEQPLLVAWDGYPFVTARSAKGRRGS
ncbi:MAG: hypothetical protein AAF602_07210 [Myxococcota bacterium]